MADLAALVVRMQADNSQYIKALDQATKKLSQFSKDQDDLLKDIGNAFVGAFSIDKLVDFTESAIEGAAGIEKLSQASGVAVESLSSLTIAMAGSGVNSDDLGTAFKKLNAAISEAGGDAASKTGLAFRALGINVRDSSGNLKDAATVNLEVADAFAGTADGANKVAIAVALYGKEGQKMIPTLDQGSAALQAQQQAAIDSGAALSGPAAEAAEALEKKLAGLGETLKGQVINSLLADLVPALDSAADAFGSAGDRAGAAQVIGQEIATVFKGIATIGLEVARTFQNIGSGLGSLAAQAVAVAHGNFAEVNAIIADNSAEQDARNKKFADAEAAIWNGQSDAQIAAAKRGAEGAAAAQGAKPQGVSLVAATKGSAGAKELEAFSTGIQKQANSFGLGAVAATQFALSTGKLADALKSARAGLPDDAAAADKFAASAVAAATKLQHLMDMKTGKDLVNSLQESVDKLDQSDAAAFKYKITTGDLGLALDRLAKSGNDLRPALTALNDKLIDDKDSKAVQNLNDELDKMNGKLVDAAGHAFDLQNKGLSQNLTARGDQGGLDVVAKARAATEAEAAYQEQVVKGQKIESDYANAVALVNAQKDAGSITDIAAQQQINQLQLTEIANLQGVYTAEKSISDNAGIDKLTQQTASFNTQIIGLTASTNALEKQIRGQLEDAFANNFSDLITGAKGFKAAFSDMIKSIQKDLANMVSKDLSQAIFGQGGPAGGAAGALAGLFGGNSGGGSSSNGFGFLKNLFGGSSLGNSGLPSAGTNYASGAANLTADSGDLSMPSLADLGLDGFATGGTLARGNFGIVGENGPELAYAGNKNMHVLPMSGGGRGNQTIANTFVLQAPGGTITRQSQTQAAAEMARTASIAARRNGG